MDNITWRGVAWIGWACERTVVFQVTAPSRDLAGAKAVDMFQHSLRPGEPILISVKEVDADEPLGK